jgi:hypothetical protein
MSPDPLEPPSGNDGSFDAGAGDGTIDVPDDARELARDVEAWRREQRWLRRRRWLERILLTRRWQEHGISGPLIVAILVAVASLGATISLLTPRELRTPAPPVALTLAAPTAAPGTVGGLLPDVSLTLRAAGESGSGSTRARDLRPAVVAIVGEGCDCRTALAALAREASANALPVFVVGVQAQAGTLDRLVEQANRPDVRALVDDTGRLIASYRPHGLTVIPVHADGVTGVVVRDYTVDTALGPVLISLKQPGAA